MDSILFLFLGIIVALLIILIHASMYKSRSRHYGPNGRPIIPSPGPYWQHGGGPNRPGLLY